VPASPLCGDGGWYYGRTGSGWWQHSNGGYGWVGPLFWPFAYFDIYDYAIWGSVWGPVLGLRLRRHLRRHVCAYAYDDLAGYLPPRVAAPGTPNAAPDRLAQCAVTIVAMLPACRSIRYCRLLSRPGRSVPHSTNSPMHRDGRADHSSGLPDAISLTAPSRLASMQQRIEAMIAAVATVAAVAGQILWPLER